jgi:polysaccharide pyruvyl transferase WcaK-like protein
MSNSFSRKQKKSLQLTICGSFGFGNAGDEAVPLAISDLAESADIDINMNILSRFDKPTMKNVIGLNERYWEKQQKLRNSSMLLTGGGIIESRDNSVLFRCSSYLRKSFTSTLALYGANVEFGVNYNWFKKQKIKKLLKEFDFLFVRDVLSAEVLGNIVSDKTVEVIGDPVLWMKSSSQVTHVLPCSKPFIAVILASPVSWKDDLAWRGWISNQLSSLAMELNSPIVFLPFAVLHDKDIEHHRQIANQIRQINPDMEIYCLEDNLTPRELAGVLSKSLITISMRLHGCVMSFAQKVPFVPLVYHPKVMGFLQTVGWQRFSLPPKLPQFQSKSCYGYSFIDSNLIETNLLETALDALENGSFEQLEILKSKSYNAFLKICELEL